METENHTLMMGEWTWVVITPCRSHWLFW